MTFEQFWFKIENREQYLEKFITMPGSHPKYIDYWKEIKKKVVEGMWGKESKGYRYCPGTLYFYCNLFTILDTNKKQKTRESVRPTMRLIEWVRAYNYLVCQGFSGYELDEEFSCDEVLLDDYKLNLVKERNTEFKIERYNNLLKPDGTYKKYVNPLEYCRRLFNKPMGRALYYCNALNMSELGARGGGKSYWYSGLLARELLIDGAKYYDPNFKPKIYVAVGSEKTSFSQDLADKVKTGIDALADDPTLGVYGTFGDANYTPNPLYKNMVGDISANNKDNYYRHEYKVKYKGELVPKGTKSGLYHFSYSIQKKNGAEAAVGTRLNLSIVEESGVTPNLEDVYKASIQCFKTDEEKFGVFICTGTSGNMETVQGVKKIFENPKQYDCLQFPNFYEEGGNIGFFLPAYMIDGNFMDKDGNVDVEKSKEHYLKIHKETTADMQLTIQMDKPVYPSHMFTQNKGSIFPKIQIKKRLQQLSLLKNQGKEELFRRFCKLVWNNNNVEIEWINSKDAVTIDSFYESQGSNEKKKDTDTDIIIYELPEKDAPDDLYLFSCDTYVADEKTEGSSLGSIFAYKNPKYVTKGITGNLIVAEYTGKPDSRNHFYDNLLKLMTLYGAKRRSLMFEANRGADKLTEYFKKRNKEHLLAFTPDKYRNTWKQGMSNKYGYLITAESKTELLTYFAEWLMEENEQNDGIKLNLERICSIGLLSELLAYDYEKDKSKKDNYDRIMSFLGCLIAKREVVNEFIKVSEEKTRSIWDSFAEKQTSYNIKTKI